MKVKQVGSIANQITSTRDNPQRYRVYDASGISPTINTCGGGGLQPFIVEPRVVGGLGEKKSNGGTQYFQQDRVYSSDGIAMCMPSQLPGGSYRYLVKENEK